MASIVLLGRAMAITTRLRNPIASITLSLGLLGLAPLPAAAAPPSACAKAPLDGQLNVNQARADQWVLLPGIGPATAAKIIEYRQRRAFSRLSQLMRVKGIGKKTFAKIRPFLTLEGETTLGSPSASGS